MTSEKSPSELVPIISADPGAAGKKPLRTVSILSGFLLAIPVFVAFIASSAPLLTLRFPEGHDWNFELVRVAQFKSAMMNGQLPPYWAEDLYGGYGSPIFLFYAPLFCFVSALCSFATGSIASGSTLALLLFTLIGTLSMKLLVQEALGEGSTENVAASRIAACCFILNPYLMGDKLLRNANAEYAALCLLPLVLYGLVMVGRKPKLGALLLSAGLALTILAHNLTALIAISLVCSIALMLYQHERKRSVWAMIFVGIVVGLGLSAFFWIPALFYKSLVSIEQMMTGKFDYHVNFPKAHALLAGEFYSIGILLPCLLIFLSRRHGSDWVGKRLYRISLTLAVLFLLLQTRLSLPIWEHVQFLPLFQFPWRMMGPLALVGSIAVGLSAACVLKRDHPGAVARKELMILLLCLLNAAPVLLACKTLSRKVSDQLSYMLKAEIISLKRLPATVLDEYLPRHADAGRALLDRLEHGSAVQSIPAIELAILKSTGTTMALETRGDTSASLRFDRWFFPGVRCTVNGVETVTEMNALGTCDISLAAGANRVVMRRSPPPMRLLGLGITFLSAVAWAIIGWRGRRSLSP
jgi:hypothetical protein